MQPPYELVTVDPGSSSPSDEFTLGLRDQDRHVLRAACVLDRPALICSPIRMHPAATVPARPTADAVTTL
jgi:hypothetical protein